MASMQLVEAEFYDFVGAVKGFPWSRDNGHENSSYMYIAL